MVGAAGRVIRSVSPSGCCLKDPIHTLIIGNLRQIERSSVGVLDRALCRFGD